MKLKYYTWMGGFAIICIIVFFLYIIIRRLRSQTPLFVAPDAVFEEYKKIIIPYKKSDTIETYVEYATGDVVSTPSETDLSKQVKIKIKWANIGGFDDVTALRFVRTVTPIGNDVVIVLEDNIIQRPTDTSDQVISNYFTNYTSGNYYTFSVIPDGKSAVGTNKIEVFYYYTGDTPTTTTPPVSTKLLNKNQTLSLVINRADLILSLSIVESMEYSFLPSIRRGAEIEKENLNKGYFLHPNNTRLYSVQQKLQEPDKTIVVTATDAKTSGTTAVELKIDNKNNTFTPLYVDSVGNLQKFTSGTLSNNIFNLIKVDTNVYKIKRDEKDEFMVVLNNMVTFRKIEDMATEDIYRTMNIHFYENKNTDDTPCVSSSSVSTECRESDSTILCNGRNLLRGEKCRKYTIDTPASGTGSCTVNINGQVTNLTDGMERVETCPMNCKYDTGTWSCPTCWRDYSDITVPVAFTKLQNEINGGSCTAPTPTTHTCNINQCANCPTTYSTFGVCRTNRTTGKGEMQRRYSYSSTNNCIQAGLPSTGWYEEEASCGNKEMCKWVPNTSCSGTTLVTTYSKSNEDTDCPPQPSTIEARADPACIYGEASCSDFNETDFDPAYYKCKALPYCSAGSAEGENTCVDREGVPATAVKCTDYGYTHASGGYCQGYAENYTK